MDITVYALRDCGDLIEEYLFQLANWHHDEWLHLNPGAELQLRLERYKKSVDSDSLPEIFVACDKRKLVGSVTLDKEDMDTRSYLTPWLASLFVKQDSRQKGIASKLIAHVVNYAKKQQYKNIYLFTEDQAEFYKHRGWHFIETLEYRNVDVDLMCQRIS